MPCGGCRGVRHGSEVTMGDKIAGCGGNKFAGTLSGAIAAAALALCALCVRAASDSPERSAAAAKEFAEAPSLSFDPATHTVAFTAVETDCGLDAQIEFLFIGPNSGKDYEALFVTDFPIEKIAAAFDSAGIPRGAPVNLGRAVVWPEGETLSMTPAFGGLVSDAEPTNSVSIIYTGGLRDGGGFPVAATNDPNAVFALYNCPQSLLQIDDSLGQSATYGRFSPAFKPVKGRRRLFTLRWNGRPGFDKIVLKAEPGGLKAAIEMLKARSLGRRLCVATDFSPDMSLDEAVKFAAAFSQIDSPSVKFNSFASGQMYFRAFLPLEKWRERANRLAQPPEVHLLPGGAVEVVEVKEDWSDETSIDPKLIPVSSRFQDLAGAARATAEISGRLKGLSTAMVFAPRGMKLGEIFAFSKLVPQSAVSTWYVFPE